MKQIGYYPNSRLSLGEIQSLMVEVLHCRGGAIRITDEDSGQYIRLYRELDQFVIERHKPDGTYLDGITGDYHAAVKYMQETIG